MTSTTLFLAVTGLIIGAASADASHDRAQAEDTKRAAIHPVGDMAALHTWLGRVPQTRAFPPDFAPTLHSNAPAFVIEMTTGPSCLPCADLWSKLHVLQRQYGLRIAVLSREEAIIRSGRLGLPWVGHPVAWVRASGHSTRVIPVAIGTDHSVNLARNIYLAFKMMTGVRPDVGVRAMAKFTGIVGAPVARSGIQR
jgi:hypothetical protein